MDELELKSEADLAEGLAVLCAHDTAFAEAAEVAGPLRLRRRPGGFQALLSAIVSQQVSVASADAVWAKLEAAELTCPIRLSASDEEGLLACGLSRQKRRYARALAEAGLDFEAMEEAPTEVVIEELTAVTGIGVWTAEIYAMFSLGRADVFAAGDLALQEAARLVFGLDARPSEKALRTMAAEWAPWRTVAATLFWQYYGVAKAREGVRT
ncbi:MAG: DNA-3-methyladenine glycosylase 2 family protein [Pseudomonadota bacterium]